MLLIKVASISIYFLKIYHYVGYFVNQLPNFSKYLFTFSITNYKRGKTNFDHVDVHFQQYFKYSMKVFGLKTRKIFYLHALALGIPALQRGIFPEKKKKENIFGKLLPLPEVNKSTRCIFQAHYHHERKTDKQLGIISCSFIY